jgi:hypothetical protein
VPVDAPDRQPDAAALQRLAPGQNVLIDAVDQRPVQVEEQRRASLYGSIVPSAMMALSEA